MRISAKFNMIFYRLILSYLVIILLSIGIVGVTGYIYFTSNFEKEVSVLNHALLKQLYTSVDDSIFSRVNKISVDITMGQYRNTDILYFLNHPIEGNHDKVYTVYSFLNDLVSMNSDVIDSIQIYHKTENVMVSSTGIEYNPDNKTKPLWLDIFIQSGKSSLWIETRKDRSYKSLSDANSNSNINAETLTFVRSIPPAANIDSVRGLIAINIRETSVYNIIKKIIPNNFGNVFIINNKGSIVSHFNKELVGKDISQEPYVVDIYKHNMDSGSFIDNINAQKSVITYKTIENTGWRYISIIPVIQLYEKSYLVRNILIITCIVVLIISLMVSNIFTINIYKPLKIIIENIKQVFQPNGLKIEKPFKSHVQEYHMLNDIISGLSVKMDQMEKTLSDNAPLIKNNTINSLLYKKVRDEFYIRKSLKLINMEMVGSTFCVFLTELDKEAVDSLNVENSQFIKYDLIHFIESFASDMHVCYSIEISDNIIATLFNTKQKDIEEAFRIAEKIIHYIITTFNIKANIGIGSPVSTLDQITGSFKSSENALKFSYFGTENRIYSGSDIKTSEYRLNKGLDYIIEDMKKSINTLNIRDINNTLIHFSEKVNTGNYSYDYCFRKLNEILDVLVKYLNKINMKVLHLDEKDIYQQFGSKKNIAEFNTWFLSIIKVVNDNVSDKNMGKNREAIEKVKAYIKSNINKEISQIQAAELVNLSTQYFSKLFKDMEGINFIDYVTQQRMKAAFEILKASPMKIEEVALSVGYSSPAYFIRKFKEFYGFTPGNIRSSNVQEDQHLKINVTDEE